MIARGFIQIVPDRSPSGRARGLSIQRVTRRHPRDPLPGAIVMEVAVSVPDAIANVQTVEATAEAGMLTWVPPEPDEDA